MNSRRNFLQKLSIGALMPGVVGLNAQSQEFKIDHTIGGDEFWDQVEIVDRKLYGIDRDLHEALERSP